MPVVMTVYIYNKLYIYMVRICIAILRRNTISRREGILKFYLSIRATKRNFFLFFDPAIASASNQSSSTSSPLESRQTTTMVLTSSYQQLNHALPVKLDLTNYVLWKSQIDNIIFADGFEDFIDGTSVYPEKELSVVVINPAFIA